MEVTSCARHDISFWGTWHRLLQDCEFMHVMMEFNAGLLACLGDAW